MKGIRAAVATSGGDSTNRMETPKLKPTAMMIPTEATSDIERPT